jgi:prefoldin subunit 1
LQQLDLKARETGRNLNLARNQVASKERERRIAELTLAEIEAIPQGRSRLYRGVGKMCVRPVSLEHALLQCGDLICVRRFVLETPAAVKAQLKAEQKAALDDANVLRKKQKVPLSLASWRTVRETNPAQFLENEFQQTQASVNDLFRPRNS